MPKYYPFKVVGYYLYYTSFCTIEAMPVHTNDRSLSEVGSAQFYVLENGDTTVERKGILNNRELRKNKRTIKDHYLDMYELLKTDSDKGSYRGM